MARRSSKTPPKKKAASSTRRKPARKPSRKLKGPGFKTRISLLGSKLWSRLLTLGFTLAILLLLATAWFVRDLPSTDKLQNLEKQPGLVVYDNVGNRIATYGQVMGEYIPYGDLPDALIAAVIATEDRRFFEHFGLDVRGLIRATYANLRAGRIVEGGSTITQQLAKNIFLTPERTFKRKIQELLLSLWLENHFSKTEIIEIYLNRVYFGAGNYGVDAASLHYFGKSARMLTLQESALLAGLLKAPSRYAPTRDKTVSKGRTKQVLLNMQNAGVLQDSATAIAISEIPYNIAFESRHVGSERYFTDWVIDQLPAYIGRVQGDLKIFTTLDVNLQQQATTSLQELLKTKGKERNASQASLVTMRPDGAIQSLIGGVDYRKSQYNRATQALRQPGSAFKLFVYLTALEQGRTANSWVEDKPVRFGGWAPKNYTQEYRGELLLREAFFRSINTVAAQLAHDAGIDKVIEMARRLGITTPMKRDLSLSLGTSEVNLLEMTGAFAHLASTGKQVIPYAITKVVNNKGEVLYERSRTSSRPVISRNVARMMNDLLTDTVEYGTGKGAAFGRPAAGKTGTSQNFRDAWFVGFTPQYVTGVWVGNDNNSPMKEVTGGSIPVQIWRNVMAHAHQDLPVEEIPQMFEYRRSDKDSEDAKDTLPWRPEKNTNPIRSIFDWFDTR